MLLGGPISTERRTSTERSSSDRLRSSRSEARSESRRRDRRSRSRDRRSKSRDRRSKSRDLRSKRRSRSRSGSRDRKRRREEAKEAYRQGCQMLILAPFSWRFQCLVVCWCCKNNNFSRFYMKNHAFFMIELAHDLVQTKDLSGFET